MNMTDPSSILQLRSSILQQNDALRRASADSNAVDGLNLGAAVPGPAPAGKADFSAAIRSAVGQVNDLQAASSASAESFDRGQSTDIAAVMLSREKASVSFQATLQVRNKLLSAYKDIMSMPV